jgi:outer membrane lipoprotein-sorting protein
MALTLLPVLAHTAPADRAVLDKWIASQAKIETLSADFTQTRKLLSVKNPLSSSGHLWFRKPDAFRWELGSPAKRIALRNGTNVILAEPPRKRATKSTLTDAASSAGVRDLLDAPIAMSKKEFDSRFDVVSLDSDGQAVRAKLSLRDAQAARYVSSVILNFDLTTNHLLSFEMVFRDGSSFRNDFTKVRINDKLPAGIFDLDLAGYTVTDAKD